jgi:hypothetical protein
MTETAQTDARAQDLPEEDRERSGENCNPLQLGRCRPRRQFSLKRRRKQVSRLLGRVERAFRAGDREKARRLTRLYLRSDHAIVVAAIEANRKLPPAQRWDERYVELLATCLDPWQGTDERVLVSTKAKENSGYRVICQFGPENRTDRTASSPIPLPGRTPGSQSGGNPNIRGGLHPCSTNRHNELLQQFPGRTSQTTVAPTNTGHTEGSSGKRPEPSCIQDTCWSRSHQRFAGKVPARAAPWIDQFSPGGRDPSLPHTFGVF